MKPIDKHPSFSSSPWESLVRRPGRPAPSPCTQVQRRPAHRVRHHMEFGLGNWKRLREFPRPDSHAVGYAASSSACLSKSIDETVCGKSLVSSALGWPEGLMLHASGAKHRACNHYSGQYNRAGSATPTMNMFSHALQPNCNSAFHFNLVKFPAAVSLGRTGVGQIHSVNVK